MKPLTESRFIYVFALLIPVINAIATSTVNYFPPGTLNPGTLRAIVIGLFSIYFVINSYPTDRMSGFILLFLIYLFSLVLLSSNFGKSFYEYIKIVLSMLMFPLGLCVINTREKLLKLNRVYLFVLIFFILDIAFANVFQYGRSDYLEGSFYFGSARVNITKAMVILIIVAPITFLLENKKHHKWMAIVFILGLLITLVGIKRSVLLSAMASLAIYFISSPHKKRLVRVGLIVLFFVVTFLSFYVDVFLDRFYARGERVMITEETFETESRYNEVFLVIDSWSTGSFKRKIVGYEFLNDRELYSAQRMLHTDYMIMLSGAGLLGLVLWFVQYLLLIHFKNSYYQKLQGITFYRELNTIFWMLLAAQLLMSISGTIYSLNTRALLFLYWGAIIGTMRTEVFNIQAQRAATDSKQLN